jgi:hypothetical protein
MAESCEHLDQVVNSKRKAVKPSAHGCKECLESGDEWAHLRLCMSCGHVGCCDSSPNQHATKHARSTHHPVIKSYEPGEDWAFCYPDELTIEGVGALPGEAASRHYSAR